MTQSKSHKHTPEVWFLITLSLVVSCLIAWLMPQTQNPGVWSRFWLLHTFAFDVAGLGLCAVVCLSLVQWLWPGPKMAIVTQSMLRSSLLLMVLCATCYLTSMMLMAQHVLPSKVWAQFISPFLMFPIGLFALFALVLWMPRWVRSIPLCGALGLILPGLGLVYLRVSYLLFPKELIPAVSCDASLWSWFWPSYVSIWQDMGSLVLGAGVFIWTVSDVRHRFWLWDASSDKKSGPVYDQGLMRMP